MLTYENFHKKLMIRRMINFFKPLIIDSKTFEFPKSSIFYLLKVSDLRPVLNKSNIPYLSKIDQKVYVKTNCDYNSEILLGSSRRNTNTLLSIIEDYKDDEKTFKFLQPNIQNLNILDKDLLIINHSCANYAHVYNTNPLNEYYKWHNSFYTTILDLNTSGTRNVFVNIDLPLNLPSRSDLNKYVKNINRQSLEIFTDYKYLNLLNLWEYLTPEHSKNSAFGMIGLEASKKVNLMFNIESKLIVINLYYLASLVKEFDVPDSKQSFPSKTIKNLIYIFLHRILINPSMDSALIDNTEQPAKIRVDITGATGTTTISNLEDINEDNIEDYLNTLLTDTVNEKEDTETDNLEILTTAIEVDNALKSNNTYKVYESVDEVNSEEPDFTSKLVGEISKLREQGNLTKAQFENQNEKINTVLNKEVTINGGPIKISEILDISKDTYEITDSEISDTAVVFDKAYNKNTVNAFRKNYINNNYKKDLIRSVFAITNNGVLIEDFDIKEEETILGGTEIYTFKISTLNGRSSTNKLVLPKIEDDGTFKLSGNTYTLRPQKSDLPIRKIDFNMVALSSYYGKLFVTKATYKKDDIGYYIRKELIKKYDEDIKLRDLVLIPSDNLECIVPQDYNVISRYIKSFKYDNNFYSFEYINRKKIVPNMTDDLLSKIEQNGKYVLFGLTANNLPIVMDISNNIYILKDNKYEPTDRIFTLLNIDLDNGPVEFLNIRLYKQQIPLVVLLCYYIGLTNLLKLLKINYVTTDKPNTKITSKQYKVKFKDTTLIIDKDYGKGDSIFYGLRSIKDELIKVNVKNLDDKNKFTILFHSLGYSVLYVNEIKMLENMYIDPITLTILQQLKLPVNFKGLLLKAADILLDDNYRNPRDVTDMSIKSYERVCGLVYNELMSSLKDHNNRSYFSKSKLTINPYSLINKINEDSTTVLVDDLNPIANIKQNEDLTMLGSFGRSKDGMSRDTREMHKSEIGLVSEASKDSGDVGISAYMTANPSITNTRGIIEGTVVTEDISWSNILSTSSMLAPFAINEDVKRLNFINIQNSHTVFMDNMKVPYIRTGYEPIIANKASSKFVVKAIDNGEVVSVSKSSMSVKYETDNKIVKYKISDWTSKEESGACYTHTMVSNFVAGSKFIKDDSLIYDKMFFEPDIFNPNRVIYKSGTFVNVTLTEDLVTYEDSAAISSSLTDALGTTVTKVKSSVINNTDAIFNNKIVGDKLEPNDVLFTIIDGNLIKDKILDQRALEILQNFKSVSPKAKLRGVISKIVIYYNCDIETLNPSLRKLVETSDNYLKETTGFTGRVNSSYSIQGIPLLENQLEIKTYIKVGDKMGIGDKAILANQLKFTVGDVFDYTIKTILDGKKTDLLFSDKSLAARIVNSPFLIGTTSTVLDVTANKAVAMYFGK